MVALAGCVHDGTWSFERALSGPKVKTPPPPKVSLEYLRTAERVEMLGRRIIEQNTFTGLNPLFHTAGVKDLVLFHRGPEELIISEALANRCKVEAELAAVLCSQLGRMMAERRSARDLGREVESFPEVGQGVKKQPKEKPKEPPATVASATAPADPDQLARDLMRGAGFDPAELDRVGPLLKLVERNDALRKQMAGPAPAPTWKR